MMLVISSSASRSRMRREGLGPGLAQVHVGQHAAELLGHRMPCEFLDRLRQRAQERRAGLHQQRQQIEQERHAPLDRLQPRGGLPGQPAAAAARPSAATANAAGSSPPAPNFATKK